VVAVSQCIGLDAPLEALHDARALLVRLDLKDGRRLDRRVVDELTPHPNLATSSHPTMVSYERFGNVT
jgi:hypothetical protein